MTAFTYKAVNAMGRSASGQMHAENETDLEIRLMRQGLDLISCRIPSNNLAYFNRNKIRAKDLLLFCFQMHQLSHAGLPLLSCLSELQTSHDNPHFQQVIASLSAELEAGKTLSQAMAHHPKVFNTVFISLVHAGEQTGQLPLVFNELFCTLRWQNDLMSQAKKLLAYPIFVALVVLSTVTFLMTYLVPQMAAFLQNMGQSLPLNTRLLIALADTLAAYWWLLISLPILGLIAFSLLIQRSPVLRYRYDQLKLQLPITGPILQKIIMARFSRYFALMYQTGIPILDAIHISQGLVGNQVVANSLVQVHADISGGEAMSDSFNNAGLFPKLVVRMIKVGESTGGLDKSLFTISEFYDQEVRDAMQSLLKLIEPLLTVLLGSLLGFIMYSVLGPVYDSFSTLKI